MFIRCTQGITIHVKSLIESKLINWKKDNIYFQMRLGWI